MRATNAAWSRAHKKNLIGIPSVIKVMGGNYDSFPTSYLLFDRIQDQGTGDDIESIDWFIE